MSVLIHKISTATSIPPNKPVKILLAGLQNSGKSSICEKLSGLPMSTIERISASTMVEYHLPQSVMQSVIWVPPGQLRSRKDLHSSGGTIEPDSVFSAVDVFGFVVDSADQDLFDQARSELDCCLKDLMIYSPLISQVYLLVHKQDIRSASSVDETFHFFNQGDKLVNFEMIEPRATSIYDGTAEKWLLEIRRKIFPYERHPLLNREIKDLQTDLNADNVILVDGLGLPVISAISDTIDEDLVCAAFSHLINGEEQYQNTRFPDMNFFRGKHLYTVYQFVEGLVFMQKITESLYLFIDNPSVPLGMIVLQLSRAANRITALI